MAISPTGITNDELLDLIVSTREYADPADFSITQDKVNYYAVDALLTPERITPITGEKATFRAKLDDGNLGAHVLLYEEMDLNVLNLLTQGEEEWRIQRTPMVWNRFELLRNADAEGTQILKLLNAVRLDAQQATAKALDDAFFAPPSTDPRMPHGLLYFVPLFAAGQSGAGFYGGTYSDDFTTVSGIAPCTSGSNTTSITGGKPRWRCYQAGGEGYYTDWDQTLLDTMDLARASIQFVAPRIVTAKGITKAWTDWRIMVNIKTRIGLRKLLKDANDANGTDLAFYENEIVYGRIPLTHVAAMDSGVYATYDPIFFVNFNDWRFFTVKGSFMLEADPQIPWNLPDVCVSSMSTQYAIACISRRTQAVINKTA